MPSTVSFLGLGLLGLDLGVAPFSGDLDLGVVSAGLTGDLDLGVLSAGLTGDS